MADLIADVAMIYWQVYKLVSKRSPARAATCKDLLKSGTFANSLLKMIKSAEEDGQGNASSGLFELQKMMAKAAKGGHHAAD